MIGDQNSCTVSLCVAGRLTRIVKHQNGEEMQDFLSKYQINVTEGEKKLGVLLVGTSVAISNFDERVILMKEFCFVFNETQ